MRRKPLILALTSLVAIAVTLIAIEGLLRILPRVAPIPLPYHEVLGWKPRPNMRLRQTVTDSSGAERRIDYYATNAKSFREYGRTDSARPKFLFIGDSLTGGAFTSNADAYFSVFKRTLSVEVFAFGASGYGSLQEYMVLDETVDEIRPDFFVLQFSPNDFENNHLGLESGVLLRNQKNLRPYLVDGRVVYRLRRDHPWVMLYLHSHLFRLLDLRLQKLQFEWYGGYSRPPTTDAERRKISQLQRAAVDVTGEIFSMMARRVPDHTRRFTFSFTSKRGTREWLQVSRAAGFTPIPEVAGAVEDAEASGVSVRAPDGKHWNVEGHRIAGEKLVEYFRDRLE